MHFVLPVPARSASDLPLSYTLWGSTYVEDLEDVCGVREAYWRLAEMCFSIQESEINLLKFITGLGNRERKDKDSEGHTRSTTVARNHIL